MTQPWMRVFPADEVFEFQGSTVEEIGLVMRLRWYAAAHNGIPNTEDALNRIAKGIGLTRGKFRKLWQFVSEKFTEIDGFLFYGPDQEKRLEADEDRRKSQESGRKGAEIRWANSDRRLRSVPKTDVAPLSENDSYHLHHQTPSEVLSTSGGYTTPPTNAREVGRVDSPPATKQPLTDEEYQAFVVHCAEVRSPDGEQGVSLPSRKLCSRIRAKFPGKSVPEIVKVLPKYNGQHSPGMWDEITPERLELETLNQSIRRDAPRKPTERELQYERQMAWAREETRKQAKT
jgi:hypothetical protein